MRTRIATVAATLALALALGASPVLAGNPADRALGIPAAGMAFACGSTSLLVTSGTMDFVSHTTYSASGDWSSTGTITLAQVKAVDTAGNEYSVIGAAHFGLSYNAQTGVVVANVDGADVSQAVTTFRFQFVGKGGGIVGRLDILQHISPNGNYNEVLAGGCAFA